MTTNAKRAEWARRSANEYALLTGLTDAEHPIVDLVASLGHYAQALGLDYLDLMRIAIGHWHLEQIDPESIDPLPPVSIIIYGAAARVLA